MTLRKFNIWLFGFAIGFIGASELWDRTYGVKYADRNILNLAQYSFAYGCMYGRGTMNTNNYNECVTQSEKERAHLQEVFNRVEDMFRSGQVR